MMVYLLTSVFVGSYLLIITCQCVCVEGVEHIYVIVFMPKALMCVHLLLYICARWQHMCDNSDSLFLMATHWGGNKREGTLSLFILFGFPRKSSFLPLFFNWSSLHSHNNKLLPPLLLADCYYAALFPGQQQELISLSQSCAKVAGGCVCLCAHVSVCARTHLQCHKEAKCPYLALFPLTDKFVLSVPLKWIVANIYSGTQLKLASSRNYYLFIHIYQYVPFIV